MDVFTLFFWSWIFVNTELCMGRKFILNASVHTQVSISSKSPDISSQLNTVLCACSTDLEVPVGTWPHLEAAAGSLVTAGIPVRSVCTQNLLFPTPYLRMGIVLESMYLCVTF